MSSLDRITYYIELPLKLLEWVLKNFVPIIVFIGCMYLVYKVYKYKEKIADWLWKIKKQKPKQTYYDKYLKGGK